MTAAITAGVLLLLVAPLPPWCLDVAIVASFMASLLLLTAALHVRHPVAFSSFPALLLVATLLRLAIAIASTRMILLHAQAGAIIHAIGSVAVGANVLVGLVVFAVLGVVQFIVVAKGGDRVAEVAARFTLDSIPGRQMSVDADLRAGVLGAAQASGRRRALERETYLYGAMDGAMKFVKGDSIATFLVALVNLAGGIGVGMLQRDLALGEALRTYSILSIGDGLAAQIPSLLGALAAALLITRASGQGEDDSSDLAGEAGRQLARLPQALGMTAALLVAIGLFPGMPAPAFLTAGIALGALTAVVIRQARVEANSQRAPMPAMTRDGGHYVPRILDDIELGTATPLRVRISGQALSALVPEVLNERLGQMRRQLTLDLGLPFPGLSLLRDDLLPPGYYVLDIDETPYESSVLIGNHLLVSSQDVHFAQATSGYRPGYADSRWLPASETAALDPASFALAEPSEVLCLHLLETYRRHAARFFGLQETRFLLDRLAREFEALVSQFESRVGAIALTATLRELLADGISVRNLRSVLDALLAVPTSELNHDRMVREARIALGAQICRQYMAPQATHLQADILEPRWQAELETWITPGSDGEPALLPPPEMLAALAPLADWRQSSPFPLITSASLRPHLARLLPAPGGQAPVLAYEEAWRGGIQLQVRLCHLQA